MSSTKEQIIQTATEACKNTLMETLNIEFVDAGEDFVIAKMPRYLLHKALGRRCSTFVQGIPSI